eukprot:366578-Chlamydomonas_euryale.AAC.13
MPTASQLGLRACSFTSPSMAPRVSGATPGGLGSLRHKEIKVMSGLGVDFVGTTCALLCGIYRLQYRRNI